MQQENGPAATCLGDIVEQQKQQDGFGIHKKKITLNSLI